MCRQRYRRRRASSAIDDLADEHDVHADFKLLNEIVRMLPASVTVQDEQGRFLLVNDAAAAQFRIPAEELLAASAITPPSTKELDHRRDTCIELLRADRAVVTEEQIVNGHSRRTFLTAHRPVCIAD